MKPLVMKHRIILMLLLLAPFVGNAQVTFRARIFLPGGHLASGYFHPYLIVEGEDTARYMPRHVDDKLDTIDGTVCFTGIARGARCYLRLPVIAVGNYDYPVFTIDEDMTIDSLVLRKMERKTKDYEWHRAKCDSAMRADVEALSVNPMARDTHYWTDYKGNPVRHIDEETHALRLAKLYYADWLFPLASRRTYPHAADSAYRYALMAYDRKATPWLYPALQQLHRHLGLRGEPDVRKPKEPEVMYLPACDEATLADTTKDLMALMEHRQWLDYFLQGKLAELGEPSLCCPTAAEGTLRYTVWSPWGIIRVMRLEGRRLHFNQAYGSGKNMKLTDSDDFDLSDSELAEVRRRMDAFLDAHLPDDMTGTFVIDGGEYLLEYIHEGRYHTFRASDGGEPQVFNTLAGYLFQLGKQRTGQ